MAKEEQIINKPVENTAQSRQKKRIKKKTQGRLDPKLNERELATESSSQITEPNISKNDVFEISKQVKSFNKFFKSKLWTAPEKELTEGELIEKRNMLKAIKTFKTQKKKHEVAKLVEIHPKIEEDISEVKDVSNVCKGNSDYSTARTHFSDISSFNSKSESENILSSPAIAKSYTAVSSSTSDSSDNNELKNNVTNEEQKSQCVSVEESPIKDVDNVTNNDDVTEQTESNVGIVKDPILQQEKDDFKSMHGNLQTRTANAKNSDSQIIKNRSDHSKMNKKRQTCRIAKISQTKRRIGTQSIQSHRVKSSKTKTSKELGSELDSKNQISSLTARFNGQEKDKFKNADSSIVKIPKAPEAGQNEKKYGTPKVFSNNVKETPEKLNELIETSMMVEEHSPQRSTEEIDGVEAHRTITTNDSDASKGTESEGEMGIDCHPESSDKKGNCGSNHRSNNLTNDLSEMDITPVEADQIIHRIGSSQDESRVKRFVIPKKVRQYQSSDSMSPLHNDVSAVLRSLNSKPPLADSTIECGNTSEAGKPIRRSVKKKSCQSPYPRPFNEDGDKNEKESRIVDWGSQEKTTSGKKRKGIHPTMDSSKMLVDKSLGLVDPNQSGIFFKKKRFNDSTKPDFVSTSSGILEIESQKKVPEPLLEFKETPRKSKIQSTDFLNFVNNPTYLSTSDSDSTNQSDDGVMKKPVVKSGRSPREKYQTHCKNKQQSPNISVQSLHKSDKLSLFDRPPAPSEHLKVNVNPRVAPSIWYPSKQQIKGVNATITHKSSDTVNKFGLSPRGARQNDCSRIHQFHSFEDTEKLESVYSPSLDYDYDPSAFSPEVTKQSDDSGTISTKLPTAGNTSLVASYSSSNDCSEDSSSEDETLCVAQNRESTLNYGRSQTSEAVYDDYHKKQGEFGSQRGGLNLHSPLKKRHRSRIECRSNKFDPSNMPGCSAEIGRDMPSVLPNPSCVDDDLEWEKYRVNWDEPTYFDGENSFGVYYNDPLSHKKAEEWTNNLLKLLKTTPISILKKKPSIESFIKTSARQVRLFDTLFGNPSAHAPSQSTMKIIMESICSNYWNGEFCDKTCRKKHKMICDDFPPLSSDEVYLIVSARLMELKKPPLPMVSSLIEWLAEHKETTKLLSFSKILFTDKGLALSTKICSVFIENMAKFYEMEASSVVEYLLKFHYFLVKKQHSRIVPVLNKLIEYCQVGTYKHKVYSIVKFLLDNEKYTLPFSILDKLLHEVNSNPPSDIMETKDKIKSQLRFHEKSEDQNFRSRACTFLRTYFPVSH